MNIRSVMVIGAGQMGSGIAQVCATNGYEVTLYDLNEEYVRKGLNKINHQLKKQLEKNRLSKTDIKRIQNHIHPSTTLDDAQNKDIIIEAAVEDIDVKKDIFHKLDEKASPDTILATNTSSLSITEIAAVTKRPDKVIGMHFMNPVPIMELVEVIRGLSTSDNTFKAVQKMTQNLKKKAVEVNDFPGFVSNRILMPMINEAVYTLYEGVASARDIDQVMKLGMNHPMGPLTLADFIGLDTCLSIMETLHKGFGDDKYRPCPLLRNYVNAGYLGKKSGRGFYLYT